MCVCIHVDIFLYTCVRHVLGITAPSLEPCPAWWLTPWTVAVCLIPLFSVQDQGEVPEDGVPEGLSVLMVLGVEMGNSERLAVVMASPSPVCPCKVDARPEALDELPW